MIYVRDFVLSITGGLLTLATMVWLIAAMPVRPSAVNLALATSSAVCILFITGSMLLAIGIRGLYLIHKRDKSNAQHRFKLIQKLNKDLENYDISPRDFTYKVRQLARGEEIK